MNQERVATLLASGLKPSNVASIVGCSPARISQLLQEEGFKNLLANKSAEVEASDVEEKTLNAKYHAAEHSLLNLILEMAPTAELRDVTNALKVVSERQDKLKTRMNPVQQGNVITQQFVQINIPVHSLPEVVINEQRQILSINEQNLAPMTSEGVTSLFKGMKNEPARFSPTATESSSEALSAEGRFGSKDFNSAQQAEAQLYPDF